MDDHKFFLIDVVIRWCSLDNIIYDYHLLSTNYIKIFFLCYEKGKRNRPNPK